MTGEIVGKTGGQVRPPQGLDDFNERLSEYHGVPADSSANAASWPTTAERIASYTGTDLLVSRGTDWNTRMIRATCDADDMPCTAPLLVHLTLAHQAFELPFYNLPFVAEAFDVTLDGSTGRSSTPAAWP